MTLKRGRSGFYFVQFFCRVKNKTRRLSLGTKSLSEAKSRMSESGIVRLQKADKAGLLCGKVFNVLMYGTTRVTVADKLPEWLEHLKKYTNRSANTIAASGYHVRAWLAYMNCGHLPTGAIGVEQIKPWIDRPEGGKASSRRVALYALGAYFEYLQTKGYCAGNPARLVEVDLSKLEHSQLEPRKRQPFTDDEITCLMLRASKFWRFMIVASRTTSMRLGDCCCLEWASIGENTIDRWTMKSDKRVSPELKDQLRAVLESIPKQHPKYVFPSERAVYLDTSARSVFSKQFSRMCARCGIIGKSFHGLRHTAISEVVANGGTIEDAAKMAGHSSTKTTEGYIHT